MGKNFSWVVVILLLASIFTVLIYEIPQSYSKHYQVFDMMSDHSTNNLLYEGQNYTMSALTYTVKANVGDAMDLTVLVHGNNGVWATAFVEKSDGTPIFSFNTVTNYPPTYSMIVGNSSLLNYGTTKDLPYSAGADGTTYLIQLGYPQQELVDGVWNSGGIDGQYLISVNLYSNIVHETYLAVAIIFLVAGIITAMAIILGSILKPKKAGATNSGVAGVQNSFAVRSSVRLKH